MPFFSRKFTILVQFESQSKTILTSKFKIVNGSYVEPQTLEFSLGEDILGSSPQHFKMLKFTQLISLGLALPDESLRRKLEELSEHHTLFGFVAVNQDKLFFNCCLLRTWRKRRSKSDLFHWIQIQLD